MNPLSRSCAAALLIALLGATAPRVALAGDKAGAEILLVQGLKLKEKGEYSEACAKLEESLRLFASVNTEYHLADCHELEGKTASAYLAFLDIAEKANARGESAKEEKALARAHAIAPKVSRLTLDVIAHGAGLEIKRNGVVVEKVKWGEPLPTDPGTYTIEASAPGKVTWHTSVQVHADGALERVVIPELDEVVTQKKWWTEPASTTKFVVDAPSTVGTPGKTQRALGVYVGALGLVGLGVSGALAYSAKSTYDHASCSGSACDPRGAEARETAHDRRSVATIVLAVSAVAIVGGGVLWLTAPSREERAKGGVKLSTGVSLGGVVLGGSF